MRTTLFFEDEYEIPDWVNFSFIFKAKNEYLLNKNIQNFEKHHPFLTLVSLEILDEWISVLGEPLFTDEKQLYRELLYRFKKYKHLRYYQPEENLVMFLNMLDEFSKWRKERR